MTTDSLILQVTDSATIIRTTDTLVTAIGSNVAGPTGPAGAAGDKYLCTSSSTVTYGIGTKVFTVPAGLAWTPGQWIIAWTDSTHYLIGSVGTYSGTTLTCYMTRTGAIYSGSFASWTLNLMGHDGATGSAATVSVGTTDTGAAGSSAAVSNTGTSAAASVA